MRRQPLGGMFMQVFVIGGWVIIGLMYLVALLSSSLFPFMGGLQQGFRSSRHFV